MPESTPSVSPEQYIAIPNKLLFDGRISASARALGMIAMSVTQSEGRQPTRQELLDHAGVSSQKLDRLIRELKTAGWAK